MSFETLAGELTELFRGDKLLSTATFNDLALRVFRLQCRSNPAYEGFVSRRGIRPSRVTRWEEIPFLPTRAFKNTVLLSGAGEGVERVFRTSGTTRGRKERGEHHVRDLALYRASLLPNFRAHLLPDHPGRVRILCLLPPPEKAPDSSLSFMMGEVIRVLGDEASDFFVTEEGTIEEERFRGSLQEAEEGSEVVVLAGTAFAFVGWLETGWRGGRGTVLPPRSRIMETGGYKGRSRELPRGELYRSLEEAFGVGEEWIVNEYGMTELLSQFYEPVLTTAAVRKGPGMGARYHRGPPWVRTLVLDPLTLEILPPGKVGILAHLDLANLGSVSAVLTEDLGREVEGGFQLLGRHPGSEPRGCSLAMEDFLASRRGNGPKQGCG